jgi:transcription elongation factor GreA
MAEQDIHYLTQEGYEQLEKRLRYLTSVRRAEVAERLRSATQEGGELMENHEYEDAKNEQGMIEGEILRLEVVLNHARVVTDPQRDVVGVGSKVTVQDKATKEKENYQLVGSAEANPREGKISLESPVGRALMGHKKGETVSIAAPDGEIVFKILSIQ